MDYAIGSIVEITGHVATYHSRGETGIIPITYGKPRRAMVLGHSFRYTGTLAGGDSSWNEYTPAYLTRIKTHEVIMVMPLAATGNRYRKPLAVLPEQIQQPIATVA